MGGVRLRVMRHPTLVDVMVNVDPPLEVRIRVQGVLDLHAEHQARGALIEIQLGRDLGEISSTPPASRMAATSHSRKTKQVFARHLIPAPDEWHCTSIGPRSRLHSSFPRASVTGALATQSPFELSLGAESTC